MREISQTNMYHVMVRGINKQDIFEDTEDFRHFQTLLYYLAKDGDCKIHAWCLMSNHAHLLLAPEGKTLSKLMQRLEERYVFYFNNKYERVGSLFQGKFKSVPVNDDRHFLTEARYIHMNPVKAGIVATPEQYKMSSYREYLYAGANGQGFTEKPMRICDCSLILGMQSLKSFKDFTFLSDEETHLDIADYEKTGLPEEWAKKIMWKSCGCKNVSEFQKLGREERDKALKAIVDSGVGIRQTSRITGCSHYTIYRASGRQ